MITKVSREMKCFNKVLSVCNNRGFVDLGDAFLKEFGPKFLSKEEMEYLSTTTTPKVIKYSSKLSFMNSINYSNNCTKCEENVPKGEPAFLQGRKLYHVLCGLNEFDKEASDNLYYQRWVAGSKLSTK